MEIVLWGMRLNEKCRQDMATQSQKMIKTDESSIRQQCRITCGADVIIGHVLPFLISVADDESDSYTESSSDEESSNSIDASSAEE